MACHQIFAKFKGSMAIGLGEGNAFLTSDQWAADPCNWVLLLALRPKHSNLFKLLDVWESNLSLAEGLECFQVGTEASILFFLRLDSNIIYDSQLSSESRIQNSQSVFWAGNQFFGRGSTRVHRKGEALNRVMSYLNHRFLIQMKLCRWRTLSAIRRI